jgi:hypothetical protein
MMNNCRQYHDLIKVETGIYPYSLLDMIEETEKQCMFLYYLTLNHRSSR